MKTAWSPPSITHKKIKYPRLDHQTLALLVSESEALEPTLQRQQHQIRRSRESINRTESTNLPGKENSTTSFSGIHKADRNCCFTGSNIDTGGSTDREPEAERRKRTFNEATTKKPPSWTAPEKSTH